ncbi:thiamine diphosphokinase [Salipaludibacillus keqinensis]|uniref:thiamine diphosphokinase n=1 Tax=Salipaludibacillus keqinensis TaxID=2045207 RepID=UPI0013049020|nr:thiamine diphosphokinase [Salipaludibacillus keqinensis]
MTYILMAGGPLHLVPSLSVMKEQYPKATWIGVDRGVFELLSAGIEPTEAFGDFDSLTEEERDWVENTKTRLRIYPCEKDETDMEIALSWVLEQNPSQVILLGATGGRLDHLFMNAQLLAKGLPEHIPVYLQDRWNKVTMLAPGEYTVTKSDYRYVSIIPVPKQVTGLNLTGFRYELTDARIEAGSSLCISNEIAERRGEISFEKGEIYLFQSKDEGNSLDQS